VDIFQSMAGLPLSGFIGNRRLRHDHSFRFCPLFARIAIKHPKGGHLGHAGAQTESFEDHANTRKKPKGKGAPVTIGRLQGPNDNFPLQT